MMIIITTNCNMLRQKNREHYKIKDRKQTTTTQKRKIINLKDWQMYGINQVKQR